MARGRGEGCALLAGPFVQGQGPAGTAQGPRREQNDRGAAPALLSRTSDFTGAQRPPAAP